MLHDNINMRQNVAIVNLPYLVLSARAKKRFLKLTSNGGIGKVCLLASLAKAIKGGA